MGRRGPLSIAEQTFYSGIVEECHCLVADWQGVSRGEISPQDIVDPIGSLDIEEQLSETYGIYFDTDRGAISPWSRPTLVSTLLFAVLVADCMLTHARAEGRFVPDLVRLQDERLRKIGVRRFAVDRERPVGLRRSQQKLLEQIRASQLKLRTRPDPKVA